MPFTDRQIAALKPKAKRYEVKEPGRTGLGIRVTPRGEKSWTYMYRFDGRQKRMTLGGYPELSLSKAHKALADAKDKLRSGIDPGAELAEAREAERNAETVVDLVDEYLKRHVLPRMKARTAFEEERILRREIIPRIGKLKVKEVTRRGLIMLLDGIEDRGAPVMRNRTVGVLSRFFMFGLNRGVIDASPAVGIRRLEEKPRDRFLSIEEIRSLWLALDNMDSVPQLRLAIRMAVSTGQRRSEIAGIARDEIDDTEAMWHLPAERSKNGRPNVIPLPPFIMALVKEAEQYSVRQPPLIARKNRHPYDPTPSPWLFPSRVWGQHLKPSALTMAFTRNRDKFGIGDATIHDLRRTFATVHGNIGTPPEVIGALLNHTPATITGRIYNRALMIEQRRRAMERYCQWLQYVIAGDFEAARKMEGAEVKELSAVA